MSAANHSSATSATVMRVSRMPRSGARAKRPKPHAVRCGTPKTAGSMIAATVSAGITSHEATSALAETATVSSSTASHSPQLGHRLPAPSADRNAAATSATLTTIPASETSASSTKTTDAAGVTNGTTSSTCTAVFSRATGTHTRHARPSSIHALTGHLARRHPGCPSTCRCRSSRRRPSPSPCRSRRRAR